MPQEGFFVDACLLVLLVVDATDRRIIAKHKRLDGYSSDDFELLREVIELGGGRVFVMPNTLTEASSLLRQHGEPERTALVEKLAELIEHSEEVVVVSAQASQNDHFLHLGLTDAALLETISADRPLLTVDLDLYLAALQITEGAAQNFHHFRD